MLFSHPEVIEAMARYECAWESLRPVPKVTIDFGDDRVIERTLMGNIATWFVTPEGLGIDVLAGLVDVPTFVGRLRAARVLFEQIEAASGEERTKAVREFHDFPLRAGVGVRPPLEFPQFLAASKMAIEDPIKTALRRSNEARRSELERALRLGDPDELLALDAEYARNYRDPAVHRMFAGTQELPMPAEWTDEIFREVLDVDLDDPWLGLADYVLDGVATTGH